MEKTNEKTKEELIRQEVIIDALCIGYKAVTEENKMLEKVNLYLKEEHKKVFNEKIRLTMDFNNLLAYLREYHPDFMNGYEKRIRKIGGQG